jgi:PiT family inorganic phosphate transporter
MPGEVIVLIALALIFDFWNGLMGSATTTATLISTQAVGPRVALILAALGQFAGPFLLGVAVARTIGGELVAEQAVTIGVVMAALIGAIVWNVMSWALSIPSSPSHALIGGLLGAVLAGYGPEAIRSAGLSKVLLALFLSPLIGIVAGYFAVRVLRFLASGATPRVNRWFRRGQIVTGLAMAMAQGANDAQKTMGLITLGLIAGGLLPGFEVPLWVVAISAAGMSLGTLLGGLRLIKTLGGRFYRLRPIHGLGAQIASAAVVLGAALLGGPVSATHVSSSAIIGAGSAERARMVRWSVFRSILVAWIFTIPLSALVSALAYRVVVTLV